VAHFQFISTGNILTAVPEGCRRFNSTKVYKGRNQENNPAQDIVKALVIGSVIHIGFFVFSIFLNKIPFVLN
jgi:hypothetical protein